MKIPWLDSLIVKNHPIWLEGWVMFVYPGAFPMTPVHYWALDNLYGCLAGTSQDYRQAVMVFYHTYLFEILCNHMQTPRDMLPGRFQKPEMTLSLSCSCWGENVPPEGRVEAHFSWWQRKILWLFVTLQIPSSMLLYLGLIGKKHIAGTKFWWSSFCRACMEITHFSGALFVGEHECPFMQSRQV